MGNKTLIVIFLAFNERGRVLWCRSHGDSLDAGRLWRRGGRGGILVHLPMCGPHQHCPRDLERPHHEGHYRHRDERVRRFIDVPIARVTYEVVFVLLYRDCYGWLKYRPSPR